MNGTVSEWIEKAESDYRVCVRELTVREGASPDAICFHAQQCIEKLIFADPCAQNGPHGGPYCPLNLGRVSAAPVRRGGGDELFGGSTPGPQGVFLRSTGGRALDPIGLVRDSHLAPARGRVAPLKETACHCSFEQCLVHCSD